MNPMKGRRERISDVRGLLEESRLQMQNHLLLETAKMANSWDPFHRTAARRALRTFDIIPFSRLDRESWHRLRKLKRALDGHTPSVDFLARELAKDDGTPPKMKSTAAKLISVNCVLKIKEHVSDPYSVKERELVEALESIDFRVVAPIREELEHIANKSPYESCKRLAMALLERAGQ